MRVLPGFFPITYLNANKIIRIIANIRSPESLSSSKRTRVSCSSTSKMLSVKCSNEIVIKTIYSSEIPSFVCVVKRMAELKITGQEEILKTAQLTTFLLGLELFEFLILFKIFLKIS